jgi:hypothetical protein
MNQNFLVITFSGISIAVLGIILLMLPVSSREFINANIEYFLPIPPISVASYILVFKYLEKFQDEVPSIGALFNKVFQGTIAASFFFFMLAIITGLLFRLYIMYLR